MDRRKFICGASGAGAAAGLALAGGAAGRRVTYRIKGFSCVTCAVGLEVMLRGMKGVTAAKASYPEAKVVIDFDGRVTEKALESFISECGFSVV
jgi:copper chaperone CopZ